VLFPGLIATGCGFSPPSAPPTSSATCTQADGPSADRRRQDRQAARGELERDRQRAHRRLQSALGRRQFGRRVRQPGTGVVLRPQVADRHTDPGSHWHRGGAVHGVRAKSRRAAQRAWPRSGSKSTTSSSRRSIPFPTH